MEVWSKHGFKIDGFLDWILHKIEKKIDEEIIIIFRAILGAFGECLGSPNLSKTDRKSMKKLVRNRQEIMLEN